MVNGSFTWSTVTEYLYYRFSLKCSVCRSQSAVNLPFSVNYHWILNMRSITGVADRAGFAHPPGTPESIPGFQYRSCHLIFSFRCCVLSTIVCTLFSFYLTLHWPSFKLQLLITSFVSFIGRPSKCSFSLPHFYLLLDITLAVL